VRDLAGAASYRDGFVARRAHATGSYEVLVYYRQACSAASGPVDFTVDVTVDGVALDAVEEHCNRQQLPVNLPCLCPVFISTLMAAPALARRVCTPGFRVLPLPAQDLLALDATPLSVDVPVQGVITGQQPWQLYNFTGESGDLVAISMTKILGSLDTLLLVLDSAGNIIDANDDAEFATDTDSVISSLRLPNHRHLHIVATRYGKDWAARKALTSCWSVHRTSHSSSVT